MTREELEALIAKEMPGWQVPEDVEIPKDKREGFMVTLKRPSFPYETVVVLANGKIIARQG